MRPLRWTATVALLALLAAPQGSVAQEEATSASDLVRQIVGTNPEIVAYAESLDCDGLRDSVINEAMTLISLVRPQSLVRDAKTDWTVSEYQGLPFEDIELPIRGRLALYTIISVEKGCLPATTQS